VVYVFAQEDFCGRGVADEGERRGGGGRQREVDDREGIEHGKEVEGHAERPDEEEGAGKNGADGTAIAEEAGAGAEVVEVAEAEGPPATKPTAQTMRTMPVQR
jgi:hypothetical protein